MSLFWTGEMVSLSGGVLTSELVQQMTMSMISNEIVLAHTPLPKEIEAHVKDMDNTETISKEDRSIQLKNVHTI
jgi:hypothetical protein